MLIDATTLLDLYDKVIFNRLSNIDYKNNNNVMDSIVNEIDKFSKITTPAHMVMSVTYGKLTDVICIFSRGTLDTSRFHSEYKVYIKTNINSIDLPVSFVVDELVEESNYLHDIIAHDKHRTDIYKDLPGYVHYFGIPNTIDIMLVDTFTGYSLSEEPLKQLWTKITDYVDHNYNPRKIKTPQRHLSELENHTNITDNDIIFELYNFVKDTQSNFVDKTNRLFNKHMSKIFNPKEEETHNIKIDTHLKSNLITISKITEVINIGNMRLSFITNYHFSGPITDDSSYSYNKLDELKYFHTEKTLRRSHPGGGHSVNAYSFDDKSYSRIYNSWSESLIDLNYMIPHEFIDVGRYSVYWKLKSRYGSLASTSYDNLFISIDPRVNENNIDLLKNSIYDTIESYSQKCKCEEGDYSLGSHSGSFKDWTIFDSVSDFANQLKKSVSVIRYVKKGSTSTNDASIDVNKNITWKVEEGGWGTLTYNDFSLSTTSSYVQEQLGSLCKNTRFSLFKNELTEDEALTILMNRAWTALGGAINIISSSNLEDTDKVINLVLNNKVIINLELGQGSGKRCYINGLSINRGEIVELIREVSCYTDNDSASNFIKSICTIGLSVYKGITSGYVYDKKIFKFKRISRSEFILCIGDVEIPITGKKVINDLYSMTYGDFNKKIYNSLVNPSDYIKYRFLIEKSYDDYMEKSKAFLDEQVENTESTYVKHYDSVVNKYCDGILVTGISGNHYVIRYTSNESWVFLNPYLQSGNNDDDCEVWVDGDYICMIDQSTVKSKIGYDTVISKLFALKNDSIISSNIYNLDDKLGGTNE